MQDRTFTQLDTRTAQLFGAIQQGTIPANSDALVELAQLLVATDGAPSKPVVVARLTLTRADGWKTIIEVEAGSTFHSFFKYYKQFRNKRSTKTFLRAANRNNDGNRTARLEDIAGKLAVIPGMTNPVVKTTIRILRKRDYRRLLNASPDELGLTRSTVTLPRHPFFWQQRRGS